ncbi:FUSC family protein [Bacillus suaedaesalsae]|uniref:Aromatic acid exporter family protein n=1 Tax=Bacillus suaedaesalsae TaxID=2810349 RepID=A0ABS2DDA8_9BACI|nr:aromatic acid exporter family protein [Bacillus suaedaesalsae]MBM6616444.1 aromatic acid exporter family protein [Bacillus suaedaesalsae]
MKIGARILKTGIAIALSLYIATLLELPSPAFAGIAAAFAVQPSIYRSYQTLIEQIQANMIGAVFALAFVFLFSSNPLIIGFTVMLVIGITIKLKFESAIPLALVTVIAIMETPSDESIEFSLIRFGSIVLGVLSAFLVNLIFLPPKYETKLYYKIVDTTEEIIKWIRINTRNAAGHIELKEEIEKMKDNLTKLEDLFSFYKEEHNRFSKKSQQFGKTRKTVLFRQMILTTNQAHDTLRRLHRVDNEIGLMPEDFQNLLRMELDTLSSAHEQLLLQFVGKIKSHIPIMEEKEHMQQSVLLHEYLKLYEIQDEQLQIHVAELFPLVSMVLEYYSQLAHLEKLLDSFQTYHSDNEVKVEEKSEI